MPRPIEEIVSSFAGDRFGAKCAQYRSYVQEMLLISPSARREKSNEFYDTLQEMIDGLTDNNCGGTLSDEERSHIFRLIREDWSDDAPGSLRASMVWIVSAVRPCAGVSEWLLEVAARQTDAEYALYLRECAEAVWDKPGI